MDVERMAVVLRPRSSWEAIDLGFCLVRQWWRTIYASWLPLALMVHGLIWVVCLPNHLFLGLFLIFLSKPLLDRVVLHTLSRALFGAIPTMGEVLRVLPTLMSRDLVWGGFVMRLDPRRSVLMPVGQLEGLRGSQRRQRVRVILRQLDAAAILQMLVSAALEWWLALALVGASFIILPDAPRWNPERVWDGLWDDVIPWESALPVAIAYSAAVLLLQPFFVAGGFSLYINRRAHLEGWDIEIAFRRIAQRVATVAALLLVLVLPAQAQSAQSGGIAEHPVRTQIDEVVGHPDFGGRERRAVWQFKEEATIDLFDGCDDDPQPLPEAPPWLGVAVQALVGVVLAVVGILAVWVISRRVRDTHQGVRGASLSTLAAEAASSGELVILEPELRPAEVQRRARHLWAEGQEARALGLLYAHAVRGLVALGVPIEAGFTEATCLRQVHQTQPTQLAGYFTGLVQTWQRCAYGHRSPQDDEFEGLVAGWGSHFVGAVEEGDR